MARRCGCASDTCSCEVIGGDGIIVTGAGSPRNPYVVTSTVAQIETGFDVQYNNVDIVHDVHQIDFRGSAVSVSPGTDEIVVTVTQPDPVSGYTVPVGAMWMFGGAAAPPGWLLCNGQTYLIADYTDLFAVISNRYGGNGTTDFKVPNMVGKFPIGVSTGTPVNELGGGSSTKALNAANMPPHTHDISHTHGAANTSSAGTHDHAVQLADSTGGNNSLIARGGGTWFARSGPVQGSGDHFHSVTIPGFSGGSGSAGSGSAFDVMPPWLAMTFIIKA